MNDLHAHMRYVFRITLCVISFCLLVWAFVPPARSYAGGFVLGLVVSLVNARHLSAKIERITKQIVERTEKRVSLGFVTRICVALLAVMVAVKEPQFDLVSTIVGMFFVQLLTLLTGILSGVFKNKS